MAKFASAARQAASVMKEVQGSTVKSVGTVRNYEQALTRVAEYTKEHRYSLREITPDQAKEYLEHRAEEVGQSTLNMERQAMQMMMQNVTGKLEPGERLQVIQSEHEQALTSRAYTQEQAELVAEGQNETNALATMIALEAGLRAHELLTIQRIDERDPSERPQDESKFLDSGEAAYTVEGKGGLVREIRLTPELADRLEERRHETPVEIEDRGIRYEKTYDISGGQAWSQSFSAASSRVLGWSEGAHGLRHSYAQDRLEALQAHGLKYEDALRAVSQEMGHFRPEITEVYLR